MEEFREPGLIEVVVTTALQGVFISGVAKKVIERLQLKGKEKILDYGSGAGFIAKRIADSLTDEGELTCVDISQVWLQVARRRLHGYNNVHFFHGEIHQLPREDRYFDIAVMHFVLHDIPNPQRLDRLITIADFLKPEGRIIIEEPTKVSHGIPAEEVRSLMQQSGLHEVVSSFEKSWIGGTTFFSIFKKK